VANADLNKPTAGPGLVLAYLQLLRIPNVFTAIADIVAGYMLVGGSIFVEGVFVEGRVAAIGPLLMLVFASCLLYSAGMVLNDVFDLAVDTAQRPQRPIPSGRITHHAAQRLGFGLLAAGVLVGSLAGVVPGAAAAFPWRSGLIAVLLAVCIVLYDGILKRLSIAPLIMGSCRALNLLLGMSLAEKASGSVAALYFNSAELLVAGAIGCYIVGVTWFARTEAALSSRTQLLGASLVMFTGLAMLGMLPSVDTAPLLFRRVKPLNWQLLVLMISFPIARRCLTAVADPVPTQVQRAVKHCILSLIILDATICLAASGPIASVAVITLLVPTLLLGRWVYST